MVSGLSMPSYACGPPSPDAHVVFLWWCDCLLSALLATLCPLCLVTLVCESLFPSALSMCVCGPLYFPSLLYSVLYVLHLSGGKCTKNPQKQMSIEVVVWYTLPTAQGMSLDMFEDVVINVIVIIVWGICRPCSGLHKIEVVELPVNVAYMLIQYIKKAGILEQWVDLSLHLICLYSQIQPQESHTTLAFSK